MIRIENLCVSFGGVEAIRALDATIADPVVGVIGPNGAGKTTLLNVFSGFVRPRSGSLFAFGADLLAMAPHRRARWGLRRSFQTEQVVDDLSVADNVLATLDAQPWDRARKACAVNEALALAGLEDLADASPEGLNTFERRMLELAKAVAGEPKVILLDEPGAGLGEEEAAALRRAIDAIARRGSAITLLIDHHVELIASTCATTLVLDFGVLIAHGPTPEVLRNERVRAAYLGDEEIAA